MSVTALAMFALALLVDAGSPGPGVAALVSRVLSNGFRHVLPFIAALWLGEAIWLTLTVAGLAVLAQALGTLFLVLRYMGVAYMLYLAWTMWRASAAHAAPPPLVRQSPWRMFVAGLLLALGNPKNIVFYLALLPTIIDLRSIKFVGWAELTTTMLLMMAAIDLTWSFAAVRARRLLMNSGAMRTANKVSASLMAGAATWVAVR